MLDLNRLVPQIQEMTRGVCRAGEERRQRLEAARAQLERVATEPRWRELLTGERVEARMALPASEPPTLVAPAPEPPVPLTVVAVDGSQIAPDPHEVPGCCLINVGSVVFRYDLAPRAGQAQFASEPHLIFEREELEELADGAADFRFGTGASGDLDARRMVAESAQLAALMREESERGRERGNEGTREREIVRSFTLSLFHSSALALMDGPLIAWPLGWMEPRTRREEAARLFLQSLDVGQERGFPVAGYISRTRSVDLVRMLMFTLCATSESTGRFCDACRRALRERGRAGDTVSTTPADDDARPCFAAIEGLLDIQLMEALLPERGMRSAVFESNNRVLRELYGEHRRIGFFFINAGLEIARVEVPEWVWRDPERLSAVHAAVYGQVRLGMGYPIALSEAHEQAVVRGPERQAFFELLRRSLSRERLPVEPSMKALRKRGPIA